MSGENKIILEVPYYSQHLDVVEEKWRNRACGIVCLKMVMDYYNKYNPPLTALIDGVAARGGFGPSGWIHDVVVRTAKEYDFSAQRKEYESVDIAIEEKIKAIENGNSIIISAIKNFSEENKFHMVVLTGFERDDFGLKGFYYHDPDSLDRESGMHKFVPIDVFKKYWRKMSIYVSI